MLPFLADENFNNVILRGLRRRLPTIDVVRVQDVGLLGAEDPSILEWAAGEGRIILTHDVNTMTAHILERMNRGLATHGIIEVSRKLSMASILDDLCLLAEAAGPEDFEDPIRYLPL